MFFLYFLFHIVSYFITVEMKYSFKSKNCSSIPGINMFINSTIDNSTRLAPPQFNATGCRL